VAEPAKSAGPWAGTRLRIILDENLDESFASALAGYDVRHVVAMGWQGMKNGLLLAKVAESGSALFITADKNMPYQQSMKGRPFSLVVLDIHPNTITSQTACVPRLEELISSVVPGEIYVIEGPHPKRDRR
jgi:hypothetical protein